MTNIRNERRHHYKINILQEWGNITNNFKFDNLDEKDKFMKEKNQKGSLKTK